jgi:hypothetical protein
MLGTPDCNAETDLTAPGGAMSKRQISKKTRSNAPRESKGFFSVTDQNLALHASRQSHCTMPVTPVLQR